MDSYHYYKPSGKAPAGGVAASLVFGGAAAALIGCLYITIQWFIPFIYINFLITLGLAFCVGLVLTATVRKGKIRNPTVAGLAGFVCGLVMLYVQWALFITLRLNATDGGFFWVSSSFSMEDFAAVLSQPGKMWQMIVLMNERGTFSLKGTEVTGVFLWIVWAIEAAALVLMPMITAGGAAADPYSETADGWMDEEKKGLRLQYVSDIPALRAALEAGDFHVLAKLREGEAGGQQYARVKTYTHPADGEGYLVLENITVTYDKKGKEQEKLVEVVKYKAMSADKLRELF